MVRHLSLAVLGFLLAVAPALAATLAPSAIVADPSSYDGKTVTVSGKVAHFQTSNTPMGTIAAFQLCDSQCVVVIDETNSARHSDGDSATATGTFHATFKTRAKNFKNVVLIK